VRRALCLAIAAVLLVAAPARASAWSVADLESQVMCPVCHQPLNQSQSAAADRIRSIIAAKHAQDWSEQRVKDYLVAQYGEEILAAPPEHGFGLLAWLMPAVVLLGGGAVAVVLAMRWSRGRGGPPDAPPEQPDGRMDARIDAGLAEEL
jgi:cytochrome c-type biogenesis protein CcmH/NrfF